MKKRIGAFALALVLSFSCAMPGWSAEQRKDSGVKVEKLDNASRPAPSEERRIENVSLSSYDENDMVRVSILMENPSTLEAGFSTMNIARNTAAMSYRHSLKAEQIAVTARIEAATGEPLEVVHQLTLAANIISANVPWGQIETIKAVSGVRDVVLETRYEPAVVNEKLPADPNMATSPVQIGSMTAWEAGYTGAGSRIAVIDTGVDVNHQSFNTRAFLYSLGKQAELAGKETDAYIEGLHLLDAEEIASVRDELNIPENVSADELYVSEKIPYGYNYVDKNFNLGHTRDTASEHGSHVSGIATANSYYRRRDGVYANALEGVHVQGAAPDAQLITMKVFGESGGAYDSDYMAAIEDAIVLECDAINLSLGSAAPGNSGYRNNDVYQGILDTLAESDTVVTISASNSGGWADQTANGYLYLDDVSMSTAGSPGTYTNSLGVASVENAGFTGVPLRVGDAALSYFDPADYGYSLSALTTLAGTQEFIFLDGTGTEADFELVGMEMKGKIAICSRGDINFVQKAENAVEAGAIATIIYNNKPGTVYMDPSAYRYTKPMVSMSQSCGQAIRANATPVTDDNGNVRYYTGTIEIETKLSVNQYQDEYYTMSDFSSWGVPSALTMKPEITAPGGNIYSVYGTCLSNGRILGGTDQYEVMSGTSMAAPQVAGLSAIAAQYIQKNGLMEKTALTQRALIQSLLMSTAEPIRQGFYGQTNSAGSSDSWYSILQQGAGLANVANVMAADSYIVMGADATDSWADGKVKAELGDDPERTGEYTFSFSVHNLTDETLRYSLSAELFTQDALELYGTLFMDMRTVALKSQATWKVNGQELTPGSDLANLEKMDFDGNGKVDFDDAQALMDYVTGAQKTISAEQYGDVDGDGAVTTHDVHELLAALGSGIMAVGPNGVCEVEVTLALTENQKAELDELYQKGAYVEGYVFLKPETTDEDAVGATHSIPVLGYYGSWTEPSMYDVGDYYEFLSGEETRDPYLVKINGKTGNSVSVQYAGDSENYVLGGNPVLKDDQYLPQRNAFNNEADKISRINYAAIRNATSSRIQVVDKETGELYFVKELSGAGAAYYYTNGGSWQQTSGKVSVNWNGTDLEGNKLPEGTMVNVSLVLAPEYYMDKDNNTDWDALKEGAYLGVDMTIDNTPPEITTVSDSNGALVIRAVDNQYIAGIVISDSDGNEIYSYAPNQTEPGTEQTAALYAADLDNNELLVQIFDYAMNTTSYRLTVGGGDGAGKTESITLSATELELTKGDTAALTATVHPWVNDTLVWATTDEKVATVTQSGVVNAVDKGSCVITATSTASPEISARCLVTVNAVETTIYGTLQDASGQGMFYSWDLGADDTWTPGVNIGESMTSATYDSRNDVLYLMDSNSNSWEMHKVDMETGEILESAANGMTAPAWDMAYSQYYSTAAEPKVVPIFANFFMTPKDPMELDTYGFNLETYLAQEGASGIMAVASMGEIVVTTESGAKKDGEAFLFLDNAGNIWELQIYVDDDYQGMIECYNSPLSDLSFGGDGAYNMFCSMTAAEENGKMVFYLAYFNGETSEIYRLSYEESTYKDETGEDAVTKVFSAQQMGDVGEGIWPATIYAAQETGTAGIQTDGRALAHHVTAQSVSQEEVQSALENVFKAAEGGSDGKADLTPAVPLGSLSVAGQREEIQSVEGNVLAGSEDDAVVEIIADSAATNALYEITYDNAAISFKGVESNMELVSLAEGEGSVVVGFASGLAMAEGRVLATLHFESKNGTCEGSISVKTRESNLDFEEHTDTAALSWHSYEVVRVEATCTEPGSVTYTCKRCGDTRVEHMDALGHDDVETGRIAPTCTEPGSITYTCQRCDRVRTETVDALGHSYTSSETDEGVVYTCSVCGHSYTETKDPTPGPGPGPSPVVPTPGGTVEGSGNNGNKTKLEQFTDVAPDGWYVSALRYVIDKGLMNGVSATAFEPDGKTSRAMVVTILYRLEGAPEVYRTGLFADVPDGTWFSDAVNWAAGAGIVSGVGGRRFAPNEAVTREQLALMLYNYHRSQGKNADVQAELTGFGDANQVSSWAEKAIRWAVAEELMSGKGNGVLDPRGPATRAELAAILMRYLKD